MRLRHLLAAIMWVAACEPGMTGESDVAPQPAPDASAQTWLDLHNAVRRAPQPPPPSPLPPLTWSSDAAAVAQAWADRCNYGHNPGRGARGENIAADAPPGALNPSSVVDAWAKEVSDYDYASNT